MVGQLGTHILAAAIVTFKLLLEGISHPPSLPGPSGQFDLIWPPFKVRVVFALLYAISKSSYLLFYCNFVNSGGFLSPLAA